VGQDRFFTGPALGFGIATVLVSVVRLILLGRYVALVHAAGPDPVPGWADDVDPLAQADWFLSVVGFVFLLLADLVVVLWLALLNRIADAGGRAKRGVLAGHDMGVLAGTATRFAWAGGVALTGGLIVVRFVVAGPASDSPADRIRYATTTMWFVVGVLVAAVATGWTTVVVRRRSRAVLAP
jgi:hypothetical protein